MKKYILAVLGVIMVLPLSAFDLEYNLLIDTELRKEISNQIIVSVQNQIKQAPKKHIKHKEEPELLVLIRAKMDETMQRICKYTSFRKNVMTNAFIEGQKNQKIAYEQMLYWDVPAQIFDYINNKFDVTQIKNVYINCRYTNKTAIEVKFNYLGKNYIVVYTYDETYKFGQELPIELIEDNLQK